MSNDCTNSTDLETVLMTLNDAHVCRLSRDRPYNGQYHTEQGIRGQSLVEGLTMRDVADCLVKAFLEASCVPALQEVARDGNWCYNDVYGISCEFDPIAVMQATMCNMEKMMNIYPNVVPLEFTDE